MELKGWIQVTQDKTQWQAVEYKEKNLSSWKVKWLYVY